MGVEVTAKLHLLSDVERTAESAIFSTRAIQSDTQGNGFDEYRALSSPVSGSADSKGVLAHNANPKRG
jgi:hypothetical protein